MENCHTSLIGTDSLNCNNSRADTLTKCGMHRGLTTSGDLPQMYMPSLPEPSDRKYIPEGSTVSGTTPAGPSGQWNTNTILLRGLTGRGTRMVGLGWEGSPMPASLATCPAHGPAALTRCLQGRTTSRPSFWATCGQ